jgi:hyperosmotically inducible periplasmic protein
MKVIKTLRLAAGALIVVASTNAWPQTSESTAPSAQPSMTSATGGSAKATRRANRALSKKVFAHSQRVESRLYVSTQEQKAVQ